MGLRITTWNVNGIRNPFGYQPWRDKRTFEGMFEILEADIVVFQETKIQRKDLRDDMVLVPGWDCYWSLPKHKKGYSGVVIYTRNATCAPIRAEEGITGILTPPNRETCFRDLPDEEQIGGYPTAEQLIESDIDLVELDSEGRCVMLEFPAFVLIGTYCPAERDETRTSFRSGFLHVLDSRIRNLTALGKRVVWTGDLNISREEIDTAMAEQMMNKNDVDAVEWISTPARRLFNQLLVGGKVYGERDEGRGNQIMWDLCRGFHEDRKGMYTCWETKVNARPGNFGARIDYVVCSHEMKDWFLDSNIQEGLMGSDHCPVYAVTNDMVRVDGELKHIKDLMNPAGMFMEGERKEEWSAKHLLPMSGKLIPEFDRRRSIKDMFSRKPSLPVGKSNVAEADSSLFVPQQPSLLPSPSFTSNDQDGDTLSAVTSTTSTYGASASPTRTIPQKRGQKSTGKSTPAKKSKTNSKSAGATTGGQKSLKGFFAAKTTPMIEPPTPMPDPQVDDSPASMKSTTSLDGANDVSTATQPDAEEVAATFDKQKTWSKLFSRPIAPKCEHDEPCKTMLTKKPGVNCGRSFWMCNRPLGPSGNKERGTQWRCSMFIWASDWDGHTGGATEAPKT
jgi:AP endonuclease-2